MRLILVMLLTIAVAHAEQLIVVEFDSPGALWSYLDEAGESIVASSIGYTRGAGERPYIGGRRLNPCQPQGDITVLRLYVDPQVLVDDVIGTWTMHQADYAGLTDRYLISSTNFLNDLLDKNATVADDKMPIVLSAEIEAFYRLLGSDLPCLHYRYFINSLCEFLRPYIGDLDEKDARRMWTLLRRSILQDGRLVAGYSGHSWRFALLLSQKLGEVDEELILAMEEEPRLLRVDLLWMYQLTKSARIWERMVQSHQETIDQMGQKETSSSRWWLFQELAKWNLALLESGNAAGISVVARSIGEEEGWNRFPLAKAPTFGYVNSLDQYYGATTQGQAAIWALAQLPEFRLRPEPLPFGWAEWVDYRWCVDALSRAGHAIDWQPVAYLTDSHDEWCQDAELGNRDFSESFQALYGRLLAEVAKGDLRLLDYNLTGMKSISPWETAPQPNSIPLFVSGPSMTHVFTKWNFMHTSPTSA